MTTDTKIKGGMMKCHFDCSGDDIEHLRSSNKIHVIYMAEEVVIMFSSPFDNLPNRSHGNSSRVFPLVSAKEAYRHRNFLPRMPYKV